jgi:hypothetical protein
LSSSSIYYADAQSDYIPGLLDIQTGDSSKETIGLDLDRTDIDKFVYFNDYDPQGFCMDLFFTGTYTKDDNIEEIEITIRPKIDTDIFNDWMYVIVNNDSIPTNIKSLCDPDNNYSADELYAPYGSGIYGFSTIIPEVPNYLLIESTEKSDSGVLKYEIFNAEKDLANDDTEVTKSIQITLFGNSYKKWENFLFHNAVKTTNLTIEKYRLIVNEGSWRGSCTGFVLYESGASSLNPSKEFVIDRKFFDAKTDFYVLVLPSGTNYSCNDLLLGDINANPNLMKHKLSSTSTHRTISFEIPSEVMSEMLAKNIIDYEIVVLGDTFGQNTASSSIDLNNSNLISTWQIGLTPIPKHWQQHFVGVVDYATEYWKARIPGIDFVTTEETLGNDFSIQWKSKASDNVLGYYHDEGLSEPYVAITLGYLEDSKMILIDKDYVKQLLTHEMGHALGFEHANDDEDIMYAYIYDYGNWQNAPKNFDPIKCKDCMMFLPEGSSSTKENSIPSWIKTNAGWWADGSIDDSSFIQGIQFLIKDGIIQVDASSSSNAISNEIPSWIKTNAGWWADGSIQDSDFILGIQHLVKSGIININ